MNRTRYRRITALLLAAVCLFSLFPLPAARAEGANPTIKLKSITWSSTQYQSNYFDRPCLIQDSHMEVGSLTLSGFCGDHSKHLNNSHLGDTWSNPVEVTDPVIKTLLAYYYNILSESPIPRRARNRGLPPTVLPHKILKRSARNCRNSTNLMLDK